MRDTAGQSHRPGVRALSVSRAAMVCAAERKAGPRDITAPPPAAATAQDPLARCPA